MPELVYSGFYGSWGYYSGSTFVKTTSSGVPLSAGTSSVSQTTSDPWGEQIKSLPTYKPPPPPPPPPTKPYSQEEARILYGERQEEVIIPPGSPAGTEIRKTTYTPGRQEAYEQYATEIAETGGTYRATQPGEQTVNLSKGIATVEEQVAKNIPGGRPSYFFSGAVGAIEGFVAPAFEPFGRGIGYGFDEEAAFRQTGSYKAGSVVGTMAFLSGGGGFTMTDRGAEAVFVGNTMTKGEKALTSGTLRISEGRLFGLGTKTTEYPVTFTQKNLLQKGESFLIGGYGSIGDNILFTSRGVAGAVGERFAGLGSGKVFSPRGQIGTFRYLGGGTEIDDILFSAVRGSEGKILGFTKRVSVPTGDIYSGSATQTITAAGEAIPKTGQKTSSLLKTNLITPRMKPVVLAAGKVDTKSRTRTETMTVTATSTKAEQRMLTEQIIRTNQISRPRTVTATATKSTTRRDVSTGIKIDYAQRQLPAITSMQMPAISQRMITTIKTPTIGVPTTNIPPKPPITPRLPGIPRFPMQVRATQGMRPMKLPKIMPRRGVRYTPSLAAWAGNIQRKLSRAERKAMFTGYELRPIPLDYVPRKRKRRKGR